MHDGLDIGALERWMETQGLGTGPIEKIARLPGGTQNILYRFTRSGRDYVLRRPPLALRRNSNDTMRREARVLGALANSAVPHPHLIATCGDDAVIGAAFYLMEPINGYNPVAGLPEPFASSPDLRHRMGLSVIEAIAALGQVDYQAVDLGDIGRPEGYLERQVSRWIAQLASYNDTPEWDGRSDLVGIDRIGTWLENHRPGTFEPGILHGDYHLANTMFSFDSPEIAAIVDWELTTIGDPLLDLGWLLTTWPDSAENFGAGAVGISPWDGFPGPEEIITHYDERSDRSTEAIDWYAVLACYKLAIILEGTYARACAGKVPRDVGDHLHQRSVWLLQRALQWIS